MSAISLVWDRETADEQEREDARAVADAVAALIRRVQRFEDSDLKTSLLEELSDAEYFAMEMGR